MKVLDYMGSPPIILASLKDKKIQFHFFYTHDLFYIHRPKALYFKYTNGTWAGHLIMALKSELVYTKLFQFYLLRSQYKLGTQS